MAVCAMELQHKCVFFLCCLEDLYIEKKVSKGITRFRKFLPLESVKNTSSVAISLYQISKRNVIQKDLKFASVSQITRRNLTIQIEKATYKSSKQSFHPHSQALFVDRRSEMLDHWGLEFENESKGAKLDERRCLLVWCAVPPAPFGYNQYMF